MAIEILASFFLVRCRRGGGIFAEAAETEEE
jgi:hypothetical protein